MPPPSSGRKRRAQVKALENASMEPARRAVAAALAQENVKAGSVPRKCPSCKQPGHYLKSCPTPKLDLFYTAPGGVLGRVGTGSRRGPRQVTRKFPALVLQYIP